MTDLPDDARREAQRAIVAEMRRLWGWHLQDTEDAGDIYRAVLPYLAAAVRADTANRIADAIQHEAEREDPILGDERYGEGVLGGYRLAAVIARSFAATERPDSD